MPIVINGSGTVTGISAGGLPDGVVDVDTLAANSVNAAKIVDGTIVVGDIADDAVTADKLANSINTDIATGVTAGTVAAAVEGAAAGIPSAAISIDSYSPVSFETSKVVVRKVIKLLLNNTLPNGTLLNVNVPACELVDLKGCKITIQGNQYFNDNFDERIDPRDRKYYWMTGEMVDNDKGLEYDGFSVANGYASITPINFEMTNMDYIDELKRVNKK